MPLKSGPPPHRAPIVALPLFEALRSSDTATVVAAVEESARRLDRLDDLDFDPVDCAQSLAPLSRHTDARVRQAIAAVAALLPPPFADDLIVALAGDEDHFVKRAAARSAQKRAAKQRSRAEREEHGGRLSELRAKLNANYGPGAARLASQTVEEEMNGFVRSLHHELSKVAIPIEGSLARLAQISETPHPDPVAISYQVATLRERFRFMWSMVEAARAFAVTAPPVHVRAPLLPLVEIAKDQLLARNESRPGAIFVEVRVEPSLEFEFDQRSLLQALQNVLQNGLEAYDDSAPATLVVTAELEGNGTRVELRVADGGKGMDDDEKRQLFVPFRSTKRGGSGIGLSITRRQIEGVHGGTILMDSHPGVGTTVTLLLPATKPKEDESGARRERGQGGKRARKRSPDLA